MTKIIDTRQPAVMRAGVAGPTAPGERTPSCGRGLGAPRRQQATRGDQRPRADALSRVAWLHTVECPRMSAMEVDVSFCSIGRG
jgi:hypothetical protein